MSMLVRTTVATMLAAIALVSVEAHDFKVGTLKIGHPWMRQPPPAAKVAGGYLTITNSGSEKDRLVGADAAIADRVEVHEMSVAADGVMRMRELKAGIEIKPGETLTLKPGSYHLMMMGLKSSPAVGTMIKGTLRFEKAGAVEIEFKVDKADSMGSGSHGH